MFKKFKVGALVAAVAASTMIFTGCGHDEGATTANADTKQEQAADGKQLKIGMSFQDMDNPYFVTMKEAFQEACGTIGAEHIETDAHHDVNKQISDIEDMIQKGINILLINPTDTKGVVNAVQEAHDAGVQVIAIDAQADGPVDCFVGSKNYDAGFEAGMQLGEDLGGKGKVAVINGIPVVPILERVRGFEDAMKKYPGIEIVANQNGKQERDTCMTVTENIIQANPDINAIFSVNDDGALGVLSAIESSQKDIGLYSVDGHPEAIEAIVNGDIFKCTVAQYPRDQVRVGLGMALAKFWGAEQVPDEVPIAVTKLTKENASGFAW